MSERLTTGIHTRPCWGEPASGDTAVVREVDTGLLVAIVDVLGHGPEAHDLTPAIEEFLANASVAAVSELMQGLHRRLKGTRGAAVGLCAIDAATGRLDYVGIGNTTVRRFGKEETRLVSQDGVVGQNMRTPRPQSLQLEPGDLVVLYTDGVSDRFTSEQYPGLVDQEPGEVAEKIVARFGKNHDDAGCVAVRYRP